MSKKFLNLLALFFILPLIYMQFKYGGAEIKQYIFPLLSYGIIVYGSIFFEKKYYIKVVSVLLIAFCSIFVVIASTDQIMPFLEKDYLVYIAFAISVANLLILSKQIFGGGRAYLLFVIILFIILSPIILLWLYYLSANAWLSVESCMAILQTNPSEAENYISDHISYVAVFGLSIMIVYIGYMYRIIRRIKLKTLSRKMVWSLIFFTILNVAFAFRTRENIVTNIIYDTKIYAASYQEYANAREERKKNLECLGEQIKQGKDGVYILVIGESATRDHMGCYGYFRQNTPWMSSMQEQPGYVQLNKAWSCANDTVSALTYALTSKNQYNTEELKNAVSIIDVANAAGYDTVWLSNQVQYGLADTPITTIASEAKQQIWLHDKVGHLKDGRYLDLPDYYDEKLIPAMDNIRVSSRMLIVIHLMGSHNSYKVRYPDKYDFYKSEDISSDTNEYDNSIMYTDTVLKSIYEKALEMPDFKMMLYFSDHGEGIDAHVGHDSNKYTAQMTRIPMVICMSSKYMENEADKYNVIKNVSDKYFTNDLIFDVMLDLMSIEAGKYVDEKNIIFSEKYDNSVQRFKTSYGKREISEE